ncbi:ABC transporter permease [Paenibacillus sp. CC-CFT747]|nr:ABC transporter permease [Paenibacillus sp. CC-CFT747]
MMRLLSSEWERLWKRKTAWLFLIGIPVILAGTAKYYLGHNTGLTPSSPEYATAENFPVMAMIEQLIVVFNVWALVLLTLSFTEEYRSGQLRMVMLRAYSRTQLFAAKWLAFALMTALFFLVYLLAAAVVGRFVFPHRPSGSCSITIRR